MDLTLKLQVIFALYGVCELLAALVIAYRFRLTPSGILGTLAFAFLAATRGAQIAFEADMSLLAVPRLIAGAMVVVAIFLAPVRASNEQKAGASGSR